MASTKKDTKETKDTKKVKKKNTTVKKKGSTTKTASTKKVATKAKTSQKEVKAPAKKTTTKKATPKKTSSEAKKPAVKKVNKEVKSEPKKEEIKNVIEVTEAIEEPKNNDVDLDKTVIISKIDEEKYQKEIAKLEKGRNVNYRLVIYLIVFALAILLGGLCYLYDSSKKEEEQSRSYNLDKYFDENGNLINNEKKENVSETSYSNIKEIGIEQYKINLDNNEKMIILIASHNCNICKVYEPVLNEALEETNKIGYKIDVAKFSSQEETSLFKELFDVSGTPMTFIVEDGNIKDSQRGSKDKEKTIEFIKNNY